MALRLGGPGQEFRRAFYNINTTSGGWEEPFRPPLLRLLLLASCFRGLNHHENAEFEREALGDRLPHLPEKPAREAYKPMGVNSSIT